MDQWQGLASPVNAPNVWAGVASPLQGQQATSQLEANRPSPTPQNANNLGNDQGLDLLNKIRSYGTDEPGTIYGNILPTATKNGQTSLALPEMIRAPIRGITSLMARAGGYNPPATEQNPMGNLSGDEMQALTLMSPTSVASPSKMAPWNSGQQTPVPAGNKMLQSMAQPSEMGNVEDQAISNVMQSTPGKQSGSDLMAGFKARSPDELTNAADTLKSSAGGIYDKMRSVGATLNSDAGQTLSQNVDDALKQNLFIPQLNPKTLGIVDHLKEAIDSGDIGLDQLDQYRRLLSRVGGSEDGVSAGNVRQAIDSTVNSLTNEDLSNGSTEAVKLLNQGRQAYASASRYEDVADVLAKANGDPNRIKQGLTNFLKNDNNTRGWNQDQIDAVRFAANTGIGENILKAFGKFGLDFSKSGTGNTVLPVLMGASQAAGNPIGVPLAVGGTIARQAQKYIARGKAEKALQFLQNGK